MGTAILLSGVLALSWRLNEEAASGAQAITQSALSPGIGAQSLPLFGPGDEEFAAGSDDDRCCEADRLLANHGDDSDDEITVTESTSLLRRTGMGSGKYSATGQRPGAGVGRSSSLGSAGAVAAGFTTRSEPRRRAMTEVEEIWGELEDDRRAGAKLQRTRSMKYPSPHPLWLKKSRDEDLGGVRGGGVNETTSLLGSGARRKSSGGRTLSYMGPPSASASASPSSTPEGPGTPLAGSRRASVSLTLSLPRSLSLRRREGASRPRVQEAIGGWWPMRWWGSDDGGKNGDANEGGGEGEGGGRNNSST